MTLWNRGQILALAKQFKVTPKTVRDIWNRRTWRSVTLKLVKGNSLFTNKQSRLKSKDEATGNDRHSQPQIYSTSGQTLSVSEMHAPAAAPEIEFQSPPFLYPAKEQFRPTFAARGLQPDPFSKAHAEPASRQPALTSQSLQDSWPGDALLLAAGAPGYRNAEGYQELPAQRGARAATVDIDPFAGDYRLW